MNSDGFDLSTEASTRLAANALRFVLSMLIAAALVACIGWFTKLQQVAYGAMISSITFVLLPFVIMAIGLVLCFVEIGEPIVVGGLHTVKPYYRWLARQKHPIFWGSWLGVAVGGVVLYGINATFVLPGESRTVEILARLQVAIEETYEVNGGYPHPDGEGHLRLDDLNGVELTIIDGVVVDGFDRPIEYEREGRWKLARYRITSRGFDGSPGGGDDFCLSGSTKLAGVATIAVHAANRLRSHPGGRIGRLSARLDAIQALRCDDP